MALDVLMVSALCTELNNTISGARIDRVSQPEKDIIVFSLRTSFGNRKLLISVNPASSRIHLTERRFENPPQPPMFCMLLRKYLNNAAILEISQPNYDRLIRINLRSSNELGDSSLYCLYVELMGKSSNLVLVGSDGRIIDCLRRMNFAGDGGRALNPGLFYRLPPSRNKTSFFRADDEETAVLLSGYNESKLDVPDFLRSVFSDLSPAICREILFRMQYQSLTEAAEELKSSASDDKLVPVEYLKEGKTEEISAISLKMQEQNCEKKTYSSFSELMDSVYLQKDESEHSRRLSRELISHVKTKRDRLKKKIAGQMLEIHSDEELEEIRVKAELVTANIYRIKRGDNILRCENYYSDDCEEIEIVLDPLKTPQQNSGALFKDYRKKKTAAVVLKRFVDDGKKELEYLNSVLDELSRCSTTAQLDEIKSELVKSGYIREEKKTYKSKRITKPDSYITEDGFTVFAGKNNLQNDELTLKNSRRTDYWFHVKNAHGSHVVLACNDREPTEKAILNAASLAAFLSENSCGGKTAVDYTMIRNVKKPQGGFPGYVIYTDYKTVIVSSDDPHLEMKC